MSSNLGGDDNGKFILEELSKNGLDTSTIRIEKKYKTSVTGAGDTFNAAVIYGIKNKMPPEKTLKIANAASTFLVSRFENRLSTIKDIKKIIKIYNSK